MCPALLPYTATASGRARGEGSPQRLEGWQEALLLQGQSSPVLGKLHPQPGWCRDGHLTLGCESELSVI